MLLLVALSAVLLSAEDPPSPPPPPPSPPPSPPSSELNEAFDFAPDSISLKVLATTETSPPLVVTSRLSEASLLSSATDTPAAIPKANLPSAVPAASPSPMALVFTVCCELTEILPCAVIAAPDSIIACAVLRATETEASGTSEIDPAPAALPSVSVVEV